jgi:hypothetical protein
MSSGPAGGQQAGRQRRPPRLSQHPQRTSLTIEVTYRGGSTCWWALKARGRVWRRSGTLALHDVLQDIFDGVGGSIE